MYVKYIVYRQGMVSSAPLNKYITHWGMDGSNCFHGIKKHCHLGKSIPSIKHSNLQGKNVFSVTTTLDHRLFLWAAILLRSFKSVDNCSW